MTQEELSDFLSRWGFAALGIGLVLVAFLVNRLAPAKRHRLKRAVWLYVLFLGLSAADRILSGWRATSMAAWTDHVRLVEGVFAAFTCVELAALLLFVVLLPVARIAVPAITGDIVVGLAYIFAGFGVLHAEGVSASSVVTTSAVVSGVLALSLQTTLGNILGGVALQLDGSVHVGDWLQLPDGLQGKVTAIRWRHTVLETRNWDTVVVPNANLLTQNIVILGKRTDKPVQHRMWVYFNVDFRYPPSRVIDTVRDALGAGPIEGVAADPRPSVICYDFAKDGRDSFAYYAVRYWLTDLPNDDPTNSRVRTLIYAALKRAGIPLARPASTLFITPEEPEEQRAARHKQQRLEAVEHIELFQSLTPDERRFVAEHLIPAPFAAGEVVTRQGAVAHWLYILTKGTVEIRRHAEESAITKTVSTITAPGFFGEKGVMTGDPRGADVIATTDIDCYRLDKPGLERVIQDRPEIAEAISRTLAKRELELEGMLGGLDEEARRAHMASAETRILDKIQDFFGLARTSRAL